MIQIRKASDRGHTKIAWLNSYHTFSFGEYYDPKYMGFGKIRVINDDIVSYQAGFPAHSHKNMEIVSFIIEGSLAHKDSLGNGSNIIKGDIQRMSAGSGIKHSEYNPSVNQNVHFLQIWIEPKTFNMPPSYEQKNFLTLRTPNALTLLASPNGRDQSIHIHQDIEIFILDLNNDSHFDYTVSQDQMVWIQIAKGACLINNLKAIQGDGIYTTESERITFTAFEQSEILIFVQKKV